MQLRSSLTVASITLAALATSSASAQSNIFQIAGVSSGDAFGAAASRAGDVDGDGYLDFAVASTQGASGKGYVQLVSGLLGTPIRTLTGAGAGEAFGAAVVGLGDLDGDGHEEVAVGAPLAGANGAGRVDVFGGSNGALFYTLGGGAAGDHFGFALARLGDLDGDGRSEVAIGSVDADPNGTSSGSVRVASGKSGATLYDVDGGAANELFGYALAGLDDQDGDGVDDFAVGAPRAPGIALSGSVRLVSGASGSVLQTQSGWFGLDGYGSALANAGDIDGDGLDDVIVGAPQTQTQKRGYVQVWTAGLTNLQWDIAGDSNGDAFGSSVASAGDPDGNGLADFAVGAAGDDDSGAECGAVRVLSSLSGQAFFTKYGAGAGSKLGARLDGGFDASGDGVPDLLATAPGAGANGAAQLLSARALALSTDVHTLSLAALGKQSLLLAADPLTCAGKNYALLGSMQGITSSTSFGGASLPLAFDRYFLYTTRIVNGPMKSARGTLDAAGRASAQFDSTILPNTVPFVGTTFFHAFAVTDLAGHAVYVSNAVPVTILP